MWICSHLWRARFKHLTERYTQWKCRPCRDKLLCECQQGNRFVQSNLFENLTFLGNLNREMNYPHEPWMENHPNLSCIQAIPWDHHPGSIKLKVNDIIHKIININHNKIKRKGLLLEWRLKCKIKMLPLETWRCKLSN